MLINVKVIEQTSTPIHSTLNTTHNEITISTHEYSESIFNIKVISQNNIPVHFTGNGNSINIKVE